MLSCIFFGGVLESSLERDFSRKGSFLNLLGGSLWYSFRFVIVRLIEGCFFVSFMWCL